MTQLNLIPPRLFPLLIEGGFTNYRGFEFQTMERMHHDGKIRLEATKITEHMISNGKRYVSEADLLLTPAFWQALVKALDLKSIMLYCEICGQPPFFNQYDTAIERYSTTLCRLVLSPTTTQKDIDSYWSSLLGKE